MPAATFDDFIAAMHNKLYTEIVGPAAPPPVHARR
jgi:hypothetical protein